MRIEFIHTGKAYLPELIAYKEYFERLGHSTQINNGERIINNADLRWCFMGIDIRRSSIPTIHEYGSLSTGSLPKLKDSLKKHFSVKPSGRVFLNTFVKERLSFNDGTPYILRDMGVHSQFFNTKKAPKNYDFVYMGSISRTRAIDQLCHHFKTILTDKTLLLIGEPEPVIYREYRQVKNIIFSGRQTYTDIPPLASQAHTGINITPNIYPYSFQTSTKVLEYCALGINIISTTNTWVEQFIRERNARFYMLNTDFSNFNSTNLDNFNYRTPDVFDLEWNSVFAKINLNQWVNSLST